MKKKDYFFHRQREIDGVSRHNAKKEPEKPKVEVEEDDGW